jgi:hypothetical protein
VVWSRPWSHHGDEQQSTIERASQGDVRGPGADAAVREPDRLYERLNARRLPPDDRLYRAAFKAQTVMIELVMALHYLTCDSVGEPWRAQ